MADEEKRKGRGHGLPRSPLTEEEEREKRRKREQRHYESQKKSLKRITVSYRADEAKKLKDALEDIPLNDSCYRYLRTRDNTAPAAIRYCIGAVTGFWSKIDLTEYGVSETWVDPAFVNKKTFTDFLQPLCDKMHLADSEEGDGIILDDFITIYMYETVAKAFNKPLPERYIEWRDDNYDLADFPGLGGDPIPDPISDQAEDGGEDTDGIGIEEYRRSYERGFLDGMGWAMLLVEEAERYGQTFKKLRRVMKEKQGDINSDWSYTMLKEAFLAEIKDDGRKMK